MNRSDDRKVLLGVGLFGLALLAWRISGGVEPYGGEGAQYLDHAARLDALAAWRGASGGPFARLVAMDRAFPPGLHALANALGALLGHGPRVAAMTGALAWLALGPAVGRLARSFGGHGVAAAVATWMVPALHGAGARYYYDLPMIALLWWGLAILGEARRARAGVGAGALLLAACVVKWAAVPFGLPMVVLLALRGPAAVRGASALALGLAAGGTVAFLWAVGPENSWTIQAATSSGGGLEGALAVRLGGLSVADLTFYPARLVASILGLGGTLALVWIVGLRAPAAGRWTLAVAACHAVFLLALLPTPDDRFLLPLAPAVGLLVGEAWARAPRSAPPALLVGALLLLDLHVAPRAPWNRAIELPAPRDDEVPPTVLRGLGAGSSAEGRGWSRADESGPVRQALREAVWARVQGADRVAVDAAAPGIDPHGDGWWWQWRSRRQAILGGPAIAIVEGCDPAPIRFALGCPLPQSFVVPDPDGGPALRGSLLP